MARRFGLALDNVMAVDVVTADGKLRRANKDENEDLYWGVRGGGGNFGVVTSFEFQLHPMQRQVVGGRIMFPIAKAREALKLYADYALEAPDELYFDYFMMLPPGGADGVAGFSVCYSGPESGAEKALAPIRGLGTPAMDGVAAMDYVALQRSGDIDDPRATGSYLVRGGGGKGEFQLHPMQRQVVGGRIMFPIAKAREALKLYADYALEAPDELYFDYFMMLPPGGADGVAGFSVCYSGPESGAEKALAPIRGLGTPAMDGVAAMDYVALQRSGDIDDPRATGSYLKGGFVTEIAPDLVTAIVENFEGHPGRATQLFFQHAGGAIGRAAPDATSFAHRYAQLNMLNAVGWNVGDDPTAHVDWIRRYWAELEPFTSGFYTNEVGEETAEMIDANYRQNFDRLVGIKNRYDPTNLFRLNANVQPTA